MSSLLVEWGFGDVAIVETHACSQVCVPPLSVQHLQRRHSLPAAGRGPLLAQRLSGHWGPGGPEPGVQAHHAPGAAAAQGQLRGRGGAQLPLPSGVSPRGRGLHLHPPRRPAATVKSRSWIGPMEFWMKDRHSRMNMFVLLQLLLLVVIIIYLTVSVYTACVNSQYK